MSAAVAADSTDTTTGPEPGLVEITVTARRQAIESADELKKISESFIDSVNADDAGKLPDDSINEVLQRIPGVTIQRFSDPSTFAAQGSSVQVRGLSGVAGRVNGREVFSANGGNGLSWSDVTPELMSGIDVYKTGTADLIEGGTGGQINLRTKMPFDYNGFAAQASASGDYADFRKKTEPTGSLLLADSWDTGIGKIGVMADVAYGKYVTRDDQISLEPYYRTLVGTTDRYIPGGFNYATQLYDRTRKGAYAAIQWQPMDNLEIDQTYWESRYEEQTVNQAAFVDSKTLSVDPAGNNVFDAGGGLQKSNNVFLYDPAHLGVPGGSFGAGGITGISRSHSDTRDLSTSFKLGSDSGRWVLKGAFQAVDAKSDSLLYDIFPTVPFGTSNFGVDLTGSVPHVTVPPSAQANLRDPSQYTYQATMDRLTGNVAKLRAENLDFDYNLSDSGFFRSLQVGARYADHTEADQNSNYNWQALGVGWNGYPPVTFAKGRPGDYSVGAFNNFFQGKTALPGNILLPSVAMANAVDLIGDHLRYGNPQKHGVQYLPSDRADVKYTDTALYGLVRFAGNLMDIPYKGNFGARVVRTAHESQGYYSQGSSSPFTDPNTGNQIQLAQDPADGTTGPLLSGSRRNTEVLPSVNFELIPNEHWQTRFAYTETMDLPPVSDIQANGNLTAYTVSTAPAGSATVSNGLQSWGVSFGNPTLAPVISHNIDLAEEWYAKPGTAVHLDLFHKSISNWLEYTSISRPWTAILQTGPTTTAAEQITVNYSGYSNSSQKATINGAEFGGHTYFDVLPGALKGLGVDANFTYIDSKNPGDVYYDINGAAHHNVPIAGLSPQNFNFALLYDYKWWSARLAYSWRSEYLLGTNANGTNGNYNYYSANTPGSTNCQSVPAPTTCRYIKIDLPAYATEYGQLDFGVTMRPSTHFYVGIQVANLTNAIVRTTAGGYPGGEYTRNVYIADRHWVLSTGYKF